MATPNPLYHFDLAQFPDGVIDPIQLTTDINAALPGRIDYINTDTQLGCDVQPLSPLSAGEVSTLTTVITTHAPALRMAKQSKIGAINAVTSAILVAGFVYPTGGAQVFSATTSAQASLLALDQARVDPGVVYPVTIGTSDESGSIQLVDDKAVHAFVTASAVAVRSVLAAEAAIKDQVRAATKTADVNAIVDPRKVGPIP
jgi:hypothetical protein